MVALLVTAGRLALASSRRAYINTFTLRLFKTNVVPALTDTAATYTECDFAGYAPLSLTDFGAPALDGNNNAEMDSSAHVFTMGVPGVTNTVYGYYITDGSGTLICAEADPGGGFAMDVAGKTYTVTPKWYGGALSGAP